MSIEKQINIKVQATGTEKAIAQTEKLKSKLKQLDSATGDVAKGMKASSLSVLENGGAMGLLNDATGGVAMQIKDAVEATALFTKGTTIASLAQKAYTFVVGTTTGALKALRLALVATGIGAIVVAIGFLVEKMMSWQSNTELLEKAQLSLNKELEKYNKLLKENAENVDYQEKAAIIRAKIAGKSEQEIFDLSQNYAKRRSAELEKDLRKREFDERKFAKALKQVKEDGSEEEIKIIQDLYDNSVIAKEKANEAIINNERNSKLAVLQNKLDVVDGEREIANKQSEQQKEIAKQRAEQLKKENDERLRLNKEFQEQLAKELLEFQAIQARTELDLNFQKRQEDATNTLENNEELKKNLDKLEKEQQDRAQREIELEKTVGDAKKQIQDAQINNVGQGIALLGSFAGKNKKLQAAAIIAENAVGIAKSIIASNAAIPAINLKYAPIPGGTALAAAEITANKISTGLSVASSIAATVKALQSLGGGSGGEGSSQSSTGGSSVPSAPSFNLVAGTGTNQIAQGLASGQSQPIQAYVVSGAVTTGQSLDRNIVNDASI